MKKISLFVLTVFVLAALANIASVSASPAADSGRVGMVTAYTPGESITIMDKNGDELTFELASELKIVPKHRANMLDVGAYVTVVTPNNVENGKNIVVQIVIHPQAPASFPIPTATFTAVPTDTAVPSETATEVPTETATVTETSTTEPATETPTATPTATEEVTGTSPQVDAESAVTAFVDWLATLFRQFLAANTS